MVDEGEGDISSETGGWLPIQGPPSSGRDGITEVEADLTCPRAWSRLGEGEALCEPSVTAWTGLAGDEEGGSGGEGAVAPGVRSGCDASGTRDATVAVSNGPDGRCCDEGSTSLETDDASKEGDAHAATDVSGT